ncbi:MAG: VacJ family lipoprotein, partial [Rhodothalassiaceae bacterium]
MTHVSPFSAPVRRVVLAACLVLALGACATRPPASDPVALAAYEEANDPLEPFNRAMWRLNTTFDRFIMRPVTWVYRTIVPKPVRGVLSRVVENANYPVVIVNSLLQGEFGRSWTATKRLLVNTTVGLGGMADPASAWGIEKIDEDFGQTLAVWGIGDGPYLVLPFIGPTNPRDAVGFVGDALSEPVGLALDIADHSTARYSWTGTGLVVNRDDHWRAIDEVYRAEDPYAFARSAFRQHRRYQITNGAVEESEEEEELFEQDFDLPEEPERSSKEPPPAPGGP